MVKNDRLFWFVILGWALLFASKACLHFVAATGWKPSASPVHLDWLEFARNATLLGTIVVAAGVAYWFPKRKELALFFCLVFFLLSRSVFDLAFQIFFPGYALQTKTVIYYLYPVVGLILLIWGIWMFFCGRPETRETSN